MERGVKVRDFRWNKLGAAYLLAKSKAVKRYTIYH